MKQPRSFGKNDPSPGPSRGSPEPKALGVNSPSLWLALIQERARTQPSANACTASPNPSDRWGRGTWWPQLVQLGEAHQFCWRVGRREVLSFGAGGICRPSCHQWGSVRTKTAHRGGQGQEQRRDAAGTLSDYAWNWRASWGGFSSVCSQEHPNGATRSNSSVPCGTTALWKSARDHSPASQEKTHTQVPVGFRGTGARTPDESPRRLLRSCGFGVGQTWVQISTQPLTNCITLGRPTELSWTSFYSSKQWEYYQWYLLYRNEKVK